MKKCKRREDVEGIVKEVEKERRKNTYFLRYLFFPFLITYTGLSLSLFHLWIEREREQDGVRMKWR